VTEMADREMQIISDGSERNLENLMATKEVLYF
jgi:hypothetical protein